VSLVHWADAAYSSTDGTEQQLVNLTESQPVWVFAGAVEAVQITATVQPVEPNECTPHLAFR
jgi:hypothetical protein